MKFGIVVFPGSNCDHDCYHAVKHVLGQEAAFIWHANPDLNGCDALIVPGGFSYGDYLRAGAMAAISPALTEIKAFVKRGNPVIGICNGFQILLESGILPGAMIRNKDLRFICKDTFLRVENNNSKFTNKFNDKKLISLPIAHAEGSYYADAEELKRLEGEGRVLFRYADKEGNVSNDTNPNGSLLNIAGILNKEGNALGMMPHPERSMESIVGNEDGRLIFESMIEAVS
ncbi:MAG: phosphoribosylformylglycinamidine synthase subunit PurQ [Nitrospinae bacterium]|nr:phosphoribosylformylglycinamidine synthase subunit PurQ [Nitrospinota bacterium]